MTDRLPTTHIDGPLSLTRRLDHCLNKMFRFCTFLLHFIRRMSFCLCMANNQRRVSLKDDGPTGRTTGQTEWHVTGHPPTHACVWRASCPSAKTTGRLILYCTFCHVA